ncbi:PH-interacting protein [Sesbania bispinosa]|nr:PH-interacting protein [Sesbania bispinosa]
MGNYRAWNNRYTIAGHSHNAPSVRRFACGPQALRMLQSLLRCSACRLREEGAVDKKKKGSKGWRRNSTTIWKKGRKEKFLG